MLVDGRDSALNTSTFSDSNRPVVGRHDKWVVRCHYNHRIYVICA